MPRKIFIAIILIIAGTGRIFAGERARAYGPNILRAMPISYFSGNLGGGLSYERILDKKGKIALTLPVYVGNGQNSYRVWNDPARNNYSVLINPGIKFYPAGQHMITYAVGLSPFVMFGGQDYYKGAGINRERVEASYWKTGMLLNNYLTYNISSKFSIGIEIGMGISYLQYKDADRNGATTIDADEQHYHVCAGYRF